MGIQTRTRYHLPQQPTSFIGRVAEIAEITVLLADPACRLLSLIGAGGIGKTRLALEIAARKLNDFPNGIFFVPLQSLGAPEDIVSTVATSVGFRFQPDSREPRQQLLDYLQHRDILLLLDNFEHLLMGVNLVPDILAAAPGVKIVVTSRTALSLREERLYDLPGLAFPGEDEIVDKQKYSAIELFAQRAQYVYRSFSLKDELPDIVRICRLVDGTPLAIEIAASWVRTLSCKEIAAEIQRSHGILVSPLHDVPERHRSMQAVFDWSWRLLSDEEQTIFKRLSVFRGGYTQEAAQAVTGADLWILQALVDKSIIRRAPESERFHIHELLRQYGEAQLSRDEAEQACKLHCLFFANFMHEKAPELLWSNPLKALSAIEADLENVQEAWRWATEHVRIDEIAKFRIPLYWLCHYRSRYREGVEKFARMTRAVETIPFTEETALILSDTLTAEGLFHIRLGQVESARIVLDKGLTILTRLNMFPHTDIGADPLVGLSVIADIEGNYAEAERLAWESLRRAEARSDAWNRVSSLYSVASAYMPQGKFKEASHYAQQAVDEGRKFGNPWYLAMGLGFLGAAAMALGDYGAAKSVFQEAYEIHASFDDPGGMASDLSHLAQIALILGEYRQAEASYQRSLTLYKDLGDRGGLSAALIGLGRLALIRGDDSSARHHFCQGLETVGTEIVQVTLLALVGIAELLLRTQQPARGIELLALACHHPASNQETKEQAEQLAMQHMETMQPELYATSWERGKTLDLAAVSQELTLELQAELQGELQEARQLPRELEAAIDDPVFRANQSLADPLTPRELEVLRLLGAGLANQDIARQLVITHGTTRGHLNKLYHKLGVENRVQAVIRAQQLGLLKAKTYPPT